VLAVTATGGCTRYSEWASQAPPFTVRHPESWSVSNSTNELGPVVVFSPDTEPAAESTRITLQTVATGVRVTATGDAPPPAMMLEAAAGRTPEGLEGHRWFVTLASSGVLLEAWAAPGAFEKTRRLARQMVGDIQASHKRAEIEKKRESWRQNYRY
jgi:hypothetical protein